MQFVYEAMRPDGSTVADQVSAADSAAAGQSLREKGLLVLRLDAAGPADASSRRPGTRPGTRLRARDLILFSRQMKMLLEAGTPLVPALEAAQHQAGRPELGALLQRLKERVAEGENLCQALEREGRTFDPVFCSLIAAGEATASLPQSFGRLCALTAQQQQTRRMVVGALLYPAILCLLLVGVVAILLFFVVPRFKILFSNLGSPLPLSTKLLFEASELLRQSWPYVLAGVVSLVVGCVLCFRLPGLRDWCDELVLRLPVIGRLASRFIFARVVRVWAAMLRCHVPLLDAIRQSRAAVTNAAFLRLITEVEEAVSSGGRVGQALDAARLADPIIVSAIRSGEESGRLAEATDFVSGWMDEDNTNLVQNITRLAEPVLLAVMGLIVGFVAMSLFIPLFDLASAAG